MIDFIFEFKKYNLIIYIKQIFKNWSNLYTVSYTVPFPYPHLGNQKKSGKKSACGRRQW